MNASVFSARSQEYSYWEHTCRRERYAHILAALPTHLENVLDFGCGSGALCFELASRSKFVIGIDSSSELIDIARSRQQEEEISNVRFEYGTVEYVERTRAKFDLVICYRVLHHIGVSSIPTLRHAVRPGGLLIVFDFSASSFGWEKRRIWHIWQAIKAAPIYGYRYGLTSMWRILCFRLNPEWLQHVSCDQLLSFEKFDAVTRNLLPGCRADAFRNGMTATWESCSAVTETHRV